jgi:hypothetical protein
MRGYLVQQQNHTTKIYFPDDQGFTNPSFYVHKPTKNRTNLAFQTLETVSFIQRGENDKEGAT